MTYLNKLKRLLNEHAVVPYPVFQVLQCSFFVFAVVICQPLFEVAKDLGVFGVAITGSGDRCGWQRRRYRVCLAEFVKMSTVQKLPQKQSLSMIHVHCTMRMQIFRSKQVRT